MKCCSMTKNSFVAEVTFKNFILYACHGSEYASVICYSLFGKAEDANKINT